MQSKEEKNIKKDVREINAAANPIFSTEYSRAATNQNITPETANEMREAIR